jgi:hypothetical protein
MNLKQVVGTLSAQNQTEHNGDNIMSNKYSSIKDFVRARIINRWHLSQKQFENPISKICPAFFIVETLVSMQANQYHSVDHVIDGVIQQMKLVPCMNGTSYWEKYCTKNTTLGRSPIKRLTVLVKTFHTHYGDKLECMNSRIEYVNRENGQWIRLNTSTDDLSANKQPELPSTQSNKKKRWTLKTLSKICCAIIMCIKNLIHP